MQMASLKDPKPLFYEPGASWLWVLGGPAAAVSMVLIEIWSGAVVSLAVPAIFLVMVSAFVALQVKAARIHVSVELTEDAFEATAICALRSVACLSVTEASVHDAVPSLLQPLVNSGFWLVGCEVSATVTPDAEPFTVETFTS